VRAQNDDKARSRVFASLVQRGKEAAEQNDDKIWCRMSSLGSPNLGLSAESYAMIESTVTHVIHSAWAVNFSLPLKAFEKDHIAGLQNLINLCISSAQKPKMIFCSSTASVLASDHNPIPETMSLNPNDADRLGYSQSKWVAEYLCYSASQLEVMKGQIFVLRLGQLTGDTESGIWNMSEAWPLMLSTVDVLGCLPDLGREMLNWLPVDVAAMAVIDIAFHEREVSILGKKHDDESREQEQNDCPVFHLVANPTSKTPIWPDLLGCAQEARSQISPNRGKFEIVTPQIWLYKLRNLDHHPGQALLELWESAYGGSQEERTDQARPLRLFATARAEKVSDNMKNLKLVDKELIGKIWRWLERSTRMKE
jgi:Male sterility protein